MAGAVTPITKTPTVATIQAYGMVSPKFGTQVIARIRQVIHGVVTGAAVTPRSRRIFY